VNDAFTVAALVLIVCTVALTAVALRGEVIHGLPALQLASALTTMALVCLSVGLRSTTIAAVAPICAVVSWAGSLVYVRFMEREP
jgi:multisubunit Na+/H+ antiporter MnhF subunit